MKKKPKKKSVSKLKKELDAVFSKVVRLRASDDYGYTNCVTCNKRDHYKRFHAGHFVSRRHNATRYHEKNVNVQCPGCNLFKSGEQYLHGKYIDKVHGEGTCEGLWALSKGIKQFKDFELEGMIKVYKAYLKALMKEKGVEV